MKNRNPARRKQIRLLADLYKRRYAGDKCYYCGEPADSIDHVPSLEEVYIRGTDFFREKQIPLVALRCCRQCNNTVGTVGWTVDERAKILYEKYKKKYRQVLESPTWEEKELTELGDNLRTYIENSKSIAQWIERRFQFMKEVFFDAV